MVDGIDALVDSLTLDEQVALLAGADFWNTVPIERAGIPSMRVSDGPVGARGYALRRRAAVDRRARAAHFSRPRGIPRR